MDHVIVDLPFVYRMDAVRTRKRNSETFFGIGTVPASIRVARYGEGEEFRTGFQRALRTDREAGVHGIVLDGKAYVDVEDRTGYRLGHDLGDPRLFARWAEDGIEGIPLDLRIVVLRAIHGTPADNAMIQNLTDATDLKRIEFSRVVHSDEKDAAARAVATAEGLVYHSGKLASSHLEPVVQTTLHDSRNRTSSVVVGDVRDWTGQSTGPRTRKARGMDGYQFDVDESDVPVGLPSSVRAWSFPDAEQHLARTWRMLHTLLPGTISWGHMKEDAATVRTAIDGSRKGRLPGQDVVEASEALMRIVRSTIRSKGTAAGHGLTELLFDVDSVRLMAQSRAAFASGNEPRSIGPR